MKKLISLPLFAESWNVAYRFLPGGSILTDRKTEFKIIPNAFKYWAADPMVFLHNGEIYIFAELYDYRLCRGTIGYTKMCGERFPPWKQIIVNDFHMSYPFVFSAGNNIYMIPETSEKNQLLLYKSVHFPDQWTLEKVIAEDVKLVDTTLSKCGEDYLAFSQEIMPSIKDHVFRLNNNFEIISDEIISNDTKTMRCAGPIYKYGDKQIRVCQDCTNKYGEALIFRCYDEAFSKEDQSIKVSPSDLHFNKKFFLDGIHTYSSTEKIEIIDIKTRHFNIINLFFRLKNKIGKLF